MTCGTCTKLSSLILPFVHLLPSSLTNHKPTPLTDSLLRLRLWRGPRHDRPVSDNVTRDGSEQQERGSTKADYGCHGSRLIQFAVACPEVYPYILHQFDLFDSFWFHRCRYQIPPSHGIMLQTTPPHITSCSTPHHIRVGCHTWSSSQL